MSSLTDSRLLRCSAAALFLLPAVAGAQAPVGPYCASTASDPGSLAVGLPFLEDGDLLHVAPGDFARPLMQGAHWSAVGDTVPDELDGIGFLPGALPFAEALCFSTLADQGGFRDGDVLGLAPGGGWRVVVAEDDLIQALNTGDALDLDALAFEPDGSLVFSLQSNIDSGVLGAVSNGDVLRFAGGTIARLYTEAEVDAALSQAMGSTETCSDVHAVHVEGNEIFVGVQSPSAADGGLLRLGSAPALVLDDDALGLGGLELDAFAGQPAGAPRTHTWFEPGAVAGAGQGVIQGQPGALVALVPTAGVGYEQAAYMPGFGAFYLDPGDPTLFQYGLAVLDGTGRFTVDTSVAAAAAGPGWDGTLGVTVQVIDLFAPDLAAPLRIDL